MKKSSRNQVEIKSKSSRNQVEIYLIILYLSCVSVFSGCNVDIGNEQSLIESNTRSENENLAKWYDIEISKLNSKKPNSRIKIDEGVERLKLTYFQKNISWDHSINHKYSNGLLSYEFEIENPRLIYPYSLKESFGDHELEKRTKTRVIFFDNPESEIIKAFVIRYHFKGDGVFNFETISYNKIPSDWEGEVSVYRLDETHLVNFNILNGNIFSTSEYKPSNTTAKTVAPSQANLATYCTITWTPGPCEPIDLGIVCYDTFTTTCYSTDPPLLLGFPLWNGSGGSGTGNGGNPGDQYLCDLDPNCIPHPGTDINPEELISMEGYWAEFEDFQIESNPGVKNWQSHTETQRFFHLISHLKRAKMLGLNSIDVKTIFSNWPQNIQAGGHIKGYWANINYNGFLQESIMKYLWMEYGLQSAYMGADLPIIMVNV